MKHIDDVVPAIFHRLCFRVEDGTDPTNQGMGLLELRLALGVTDAQLNEALWLLSFPGDRRIAFPTPGRVALGPEWRERWEGQATSAS